MKLNNNIYIVFDNNYAIIFDYESGEFYICSDNIANLLLGLKNNITQHDLLLFYNDEKEFYEDVNYLKELNIITE